MQASYLLHALMIVHGIFAARQARQAVTGQLSFLNRMQTPTSKAPLFVDEEVIHNARKPGAWLLDPDEIVEFAEGLDE